MNTLLSSVGTSAGNSLSPPAPLRAHIAADFALDPSIAFLNHGSFGARPRSVLEAQNRRRAEFEARPIEWLDRRRIAMIDRAKQKLASFLGMNPANFGFVTNATGGINAVLRSITFKPGDELLTTNHVYNAVRQTMRHLAEVAGATYKEISIDLPLQNAQQIVAAIEAALSPRTRIVVIDHITSPTAVVFPVKELIDASRSRGIDVIVDGAHAPGMLTLNVEALGAAYYAGNLHKWVCAPLGAAFIWVQPDKQRSVHPPIISHFLNESFVSEFNWQGTRDITPWLCVEDSLSYFDQLGWDRVMKHNHDLAVWVQRMLCDRWQVEPATPLSGEMIGSMATVQLPGQKRLRERFAPADNFASLRTVLHDQYQIEVPVIDWCGRLWVRPCCQVYNTPAQYELLATAILELTES